MFIKSLSILSLQVYLLCLVSNTVNAQYKPDFPTKRPGKGYAILGNGNLCAVYSDDNRTNGKGIQRLYYQNFTCSYVGATSCSLSRSGSDSSLKPNGQDSLGMSNFYTASAQSFYDHSIKKEINCFALPDDGVVLSEEVLGNYQNLVQKTDIVLNKEIKTDRYTTLKSVKVENGKAIAEWSDHVFMVIGCKDLDQKITVNDSTVSVSGKVSPGNKVEIVITMDKTRGNCLKTIDRLLSIQDLASSAATYWNFWMDKGVVPKFTSADEKQYTEYFKRNLYCVKASTMEGFVPSDITGYFVTNGMPQLYPRDAMMCARVFLLTGHLDEAKDIIKFWTNTKIPMKSNGEWYARYDAYSRAVNAGVGARYDEPEWDAGGYFIQLLDMYHQKTGIWLAKPDFIYELADFLTTKIDTNGLLFEGGIVEWSGYLPATNMTCAAALKTASKIATVFGDAKKASVYVQAGEKIASSLHRMFDTKNNTYADVRYIGNKGNKNESSVKNSGDALYLWNTTMNFGILWGYPNHKEVELSNEYYQNSTVKQHGGVQYFDSPNDGLASYGNCMFFFSTAARSEYESQYGDPSIAKSHIDWMIRNVNTYGLAPERIATDGSDVSPASPLTWCSAELAAAILYFHQFGLVKIK